MKTHTVTWMIRTRHKVYGLTAISMLYDEKCFLLGKEYINNTNTDGITAVRLNNLVDLLFQDSVTSAYTPLQRRKSLYTLN